MIMELAAGYSAEIDNVDEESWNSILEKFNDANIYQTWSYEAVRSGERNLSHLLLKKEGEVVAAAQAKIVQIPLTKIGLAYIRWGPLWRLRDKASDRNVFAQAMRALRNEFACRRRLVVRVFPLLFNDQSELFNPILKQEGFVHSSLEGTARTLLVNLDRSLEELRRGLDQKWRNRLNRAEKNDLRIVEGFEEELFNSFIEIYRQMHGRKKFLESYDVDQFRRMQHDLPRSFKMKILLAFLDDKPAAGVVCSGIGEMGIYLLAATSNDGLSTQGSYLLQWKAQSWLKEKSAAWYNLNGINPVKNPGTYRFKAGLCGKNGKDVCYLGIYDACDSAMTFNLFHIANFARMMYRKGKMVLSELRK